VGENGNYRGAGITHQQVGKKKLRVNGGGMECESMHHGSGGDEEWEKEHLIKQSIFGHQRGHRNRKKNDRVRVEQHLRARVRSQKLLSHVGTK